MSTLGRFPRTHAAVACLLAMPLTSFLLANNGLEIGAERLTSELEIVRSSAAISVPDLSGISPTRARAGNGATSPPTKALPVTRSTKVDLSERSETVRSGDSLARVFERVSIPQRDLAAVLDSGPLAKALTQIYPGHELKFVTTPDRRLVRLAYSPSPLETLQFDSEGEFFVAKRVARKPEVTNAYRHASIDQSLFVASQQIGLSDEITLRLAQIFQWDIDFVLDIRKGDKFSVLFQEQYVDGEFIGYGRILAAEFVNQSTRYRAIYYEDTNGRGDYFSANGESMRKAFLRAPVEFSRISSNFNMRRLHPIQKRVMPHRGIDYVAPPGTPILAAGDGRVLTASRTAPNGNYIILQHGDQFQTKYLHLSKFGRGINSGVRVRQGQVIGYVGATGWATAPHLHYEFLVEGVHKNPRTVPLPKAQPIPARERRRFDTQAAPLLALLSLHRNDGQVAAAH
jgi:murein DD-endopeptidase MepM/ murein hydrolase activator NlpD